MSLRANLLTPILATLLPLCLAGQSILQTYTLRPGWNAFLIEVEPSSNASELFAEWPADIVSLYDQTTFGNTRQFSSDWVSSTMVAPPFAVWNRNQPEATTATSVPAGTVCLLFCTNNLATQVTIPGRPAAPRLAWHKTATNSVLNFIGFSVQRGKQVTVRDYLNGFSGTAAANFYRLSGRNPDAAPNLLKVYPTATVSDGDVLLSESTALSDWSGSLYIAPRQGVNFGTNSTYTILTVRNDSGAPCTATLRLDPSEAPEPGSVDFSPSWLHWRDADVAETNDLWHALESYGQVAAKTLAAGQVWRVEWGLDRGAMPANLPLGVSFGAVLRIEDSDGGSCLGAAVPVVGECDGVVGERAQWPCGLWLATVAFDQVRGPGEKGFSRTGGTLKVRLPLHIDSMGRARLLQRVSCVAPKSSTGVGGYHLYGGGAVVPSDGVTGFRISAVCLPTETPVVEAESFDVASRRAVFAFRVAADGATSILRHPLHPQHDGLRADFKTPAPDGDDFGNYLAPVKPETFGVGNVVELVMDASGGDAPWAPRNEISGSCRWTLTGLRHEGGITLSGAASFERISTLSTIVLK